MYLHCVCYQKRRRTFSKLSSNSPQNFRSISVFTRLCSPINYRLRICLKTKWGFSTVSPCIFWFSSKHQFRKIIGHFTHDLPSVGWRKAFIESQIRFLFQKFSPHPQFVDQFIYICTYAKRKRKETLERLIVEFGLLYSSLLQNKAQFWTIHNN